MWIWKGEGQEGIIGVPARDLTDEEFNAYSGMIDARHPDQRGSLRTCGLYEQVIENVSKPIVNVTKIDTSSTLIDEEMN